MKAQWTHPGRASRPPISALSGLTVAALVGTATTFALMQIVVCTHSIQHWWCRWHC
jgi:hypothetical protein